eukprot:scaffold35422_cov57-Phaeocystis_antarctica.AAC.4
MRELKNVAIRCSSIGVRELRDRSRRWQQGRRRRLRRRDLAIDRPALAGSRLRRQLQTRAGCICPEVEAVVGGGSRLDGDVRTRMLFENPPRRDWGRRKADLKAATQNRVVRRPGQARGHQAVGECRARVTIAIYSHLVADVV